MGNRTEKFPPNIPLLSLSRCHYQSSWSETRLTQRNQLGIKTIQVLLTIVLAEVFCRTQVVYMNDSLGTKICTFLRVMKKAGMGKISAKVFHQVSNDPRAICLPNGFKAPVCCGRIFSETSITLSLSSFSVNCFAPMLSFCCQILQEHAVL